MDIRLEHPDISSCLCWGRPGGHRRPGPCCEICGEELYGRAYELCPGRLVCEECFKEQLGDYLGLYPVEMAQALGLPCHCLD